jgi:hypothetical protein
VNRRFIQSIILILCIAIIGTAYFSLLGVYQRERRKTVQHFASAREGGATGVKIMATIVSLDPVKGELLLRLQFEPQADLLDGDDVLVNAVTVYTNSMAGKAEATFKKGESMQPLDVTMALEGESSQYPWDRYAGTLWVCLASQKESAGAPPVWNAVHFTMDLKSGVPGFTIDAREAKQKDRGFALVTVAFDVKRAPSSAGFAIFIMLLIGLLTLVDFLAGFTMVVGGRKIELTILGWLGAMLFAMLPLRNAMPGAPPIGCVADFMSFFWAEAITATTLIAVVVTWVLRRPPDAVQKP